MREIRDTEGRTWRVQLASHGTTSGYLNLKVHRPVVQFTCVTEALTRRYGAMPPWVETLEELDDGSLLALLARAKAY